MHRVCTKAVAGLQAGAKAQGRFESIRAWPYEAGYGYGAVHSATKNTVLALCLWPYDTCLKCCGLVVAVV